MQESQKQSMRTRFISSNMYKETSNKIVDHLTTSFEHKRDYDGQSFYVRKRNDRNNRGKIIAPAG